MKKVIFALPVVLFISVMIYGCKKNDNANGSWTASVNSVAASGVNVNGSYFTADRKLIVTLTPSITNVYPAIAISGITDTAGTFNLNGSSSFSATYTDSANAIVYSTANAGVGQLIISSFASTSNNLTGSVNFIAHNPYNLADSVIITGAKFSTTSLILE